MSNKDIIGSKENLNFWKIDQKNKKDKNTGFDSKDTQSCLRKNFKGAITDIHM